MTGPVGAPPELRLRHPTEADHAPIVGLIDEWWGGRQVRDQLPRFWFEHFATTSWLAETVDGRLAGFLVGFVSADHPSAGRIHLVGTNPNLRRRGVARLLVERFEAGVRDRGVTVVTALAEAGDPVAIASLEHLGYRPFEGPGTRLLYGTPAFPDYDRPGADRVLLVRSI